jgi:hypothetical protein
MPSGVSAVYRQLLQTVRALPRDPLRPSLQLNETLESAVNRAFGVKQAATATSANEALPLTIAEHVRPEDEALATRALEVLQELKDDKALHAVSGFCTSYALLRAP